MKNFHKKLLSLMFASLTIFSISITSFASDTNSFANMQYNSANYDEQILDILDDTLITELQTLIDTEMSKNPTVSEDELNIKIMNCIEEKYFSLQGTYSGSLPQSQKGLNNAEKKLYLSNPVKGNFALSCGLTASLAANSLFSSSVLYLGNGDAFRHAYWCGLITNGYGASYAKQWGNAHESTTPAGLDKTMDLKNNQSGINIASKIKGPYFEARFQKELLSQIKNGKLVRIVNNKLVATNGTGRK